jgi:hypothetical protein
VKSFTPVKDSRHERRGVTHFKVSGQAEKKRYISLHFAAGNLILNYPVAIAGG